MKQRIAVRRAALQGLSPRLAGASDSSVCLCRRCRRHQRQSVLHSRFPASLNTLNSTRDTRQRPRLPLVSPRSSPSPASPRPSQALRQRIAVSQAAESGSTSLRVSRAFATPSARVDTCAVCSSSPPSAVPSREATYRRPASEGIVSVSPSVDRTHRCLHKHPPAHTPARLVCSQCIYSCLVVRLSL